MLFVVFAHGGPTAQPGFAGASAPGLPAVGIEFGVVPAHADQRRGATRRQGHLFRRTVDTKGLIEQALAVQVGVIIEAVAQHQVDTGVLMQIDDFAVGIEAHVDVRVSGVETSQPWHQPQGGEGGGSGDRQAGATALRTQCIDTLRHFQKSPMQALEQPFAAFGQAHLAWQALEQRHAEPALQGADLMGHRRRRHREFFGSSLEAQQA
ncbi:hypothetical protein D3C73_630670 [compost metagenome]